MKKRYYIIFILLMFFMPFGINASTIKSYYMDISVETNGDLHIKELIAYNGTFNGYQIMVDYKNNSFKEFDGSLESFYDSTIYNGSGFELIAIKDIPYNKSFGFNTMNDEGTLFTYSPNPVLGAYGVYTIEGNNYRIYNPGNEEIKLFYMEYVLENMAVVHNDIAEVYFTIFESDFNEYIEELEIHVSTSIVDKNLRSWVHGPLTGEFDVIDDIVVIKNKNIDRGQAMDFRVAFDKSVVPLSTKTSGFDGLDKIIEKETELADSANAIRNKYRAVISVIYVLLGAWLIGLIYVVYHMYNKYDKERESTFKTKYFRDFPAEYGPEIVGFLISKMTSNKDLSASLTNLIARKIITFEEIDKKNFILKWNGSIDKTSPAENKLLKWFFEDIGKDGAVSVGEINKYASAHYNEFLSSYNKWKNLVKEEGRSYNFFDENTGAKVKAILYALLGLIISVISIQIIEVLLIQIPAIIVSVIAVIYFALITKRTVEGNEQYRKWLGLKNFIKDFGKFQARDLPNIVLWEKYLVYALVFGLADKLSKTMSIRFNEMGGSNMNTMHDINYFNRMMIINRVVNSSVNQAVGTANARVAASRSSSGSGFGGGGFSSGGGFGGGSHGGGGF